MKASSFGIRKEEDKEAVKFLVGSKLSSSKPIDMLLSWWRYESVFAAELNLLSEFNELGVSTI